MPRFVEFTTNFATGELDPLLRARVDLAAYGNALAKATNVLIQPQGGLRRRPGSKHIFALPNTSTESAGNGVRLVPFQFSVDDSYMLCFTHNRMHVVKGGVVQSNINGTGNSYLTTTIGSSIVDDMCWIQSADTLIVVHPDLNPVRITRTSDTAWTATSITFDSIPKYAYDIDFHTNTSSTLTPSAVSGNVTLTASTTHHDSGTAQAGTSTTITLKATASATDDIYVGMYVNITGGTGSGQTRLIEDYNGTTKVATVKAITAAFTPGVSSVYSIAANVGYRPVSSSFSSATIYYNNDGILHKITGARGTFAINATVGEIPVIEFTMVGIYNAPTDTAAPTATYTNQASPLIFKAENTSAFTVFGYAGCLMEFSFDIANETLYRELVGCTKEVIITTRAAEGEMKIEAPTIAQYDFFSAALASTTGAVTLVHGTTAGNRVTVVLPTISLANPAYEDEDGIQMLGLPYVAVPTTIGNDEISLTFA